MTMPPSRSRSLLVGFAMVCLTLLGTALLNHLNVRRLLAVRAAESEVSYWTAVVAGVISAVLGLCLAAGGFVLVRRDIGRRAQSAAKLARANALLEDRVRERTTAISAANAALRDEVQVRQQAEEHAGQIAEELRRSNRELEQFAAVASHDLQEPLRNIQAFGDRLDAQCRDQLSERGQEYLDRMLASAQRIRKLIDDLLSYSRVATSALPYVPVNLRQVAQDVVSDLEVQIHGTGGRVEIGSLPTIAADPPQMRQLLQNLVSNALKFHRPGVPPVVEASGTLAPATPSPTAGAPVALQCELSVRDNGIGFAQEYGERIFQLFQRLHGRDEYDGTGIRLAICKRIAERHGGGISAVSAPGEGARFVVDLPVEHASSGPLS